MKSKLYACLLLFLCGFVCGCSSEWKKVQTEDGEWLVIKPAGPGEAKKFATKKGKVLFARYADHEIIVSECFMSKWEAEELLTKLKAIDE